jgi:hypothetical protein
MNTPMLLEQNFYRFLGIEKTATYEEIHRTLEDKKREVVVADPRTEEGASLFSNYIAAYYHLAYTNHRDYYDHYFESDEQEGIEFRAKINSKEFFARNYDFLSNETLLVDMFKNQDVDFLEEKAPAQFYKIMLPSSYYSLEELNNVIVNFSSRRDGDEIGFFGGVMGVKGIEQGDPKHPMKFANAICDALERKRQDIELDSTIFKHPEFPSMRNYTAVESCIDWGGKRDDLQVIAEKFMTFNNTNIKEKIVSILLEKKSDAKHSDKYDVEAKRLIRLARKAVESDPHFYLSHQSFINGFYKLCTGNLQNPEARSFAAVLLTGDVTSKPIAIELQNLIPPAGTPAFEFSRAAKGSVGGTVKSFVSKVGNVFGLGNGPH